MQEYKQEGSPYKTIYIVNNFKTKHFKFCQFLRPPRFLQLQQSLKKKMMHKTTWEAVILWRTQSMRLTCIINFCWHVLTDNVWNVIMQLFLFRPMYSVLKPIGVWEIERNMLGRMSKLQVKKKENI